MKKITINITKDSLLFKYRTNKPVSTNLLNTNVISNNELVFSDEYIYDNINLVRLFISDLCLEKSISNIIISNSDMISLVFDIINGINYIKSMTISDDAILSYATCERLLKSKIKRLNCYSAPTFMLELLDKNNIVVESRNEVLFTSNFMQDNNLDSFSKIYYKSSILINNIISKDDIDDLKAFCNINKYLRIININKYSDNTIETIVSILRVNKKKNIVINIHEDINNPDEIIKLRELNKNLKKYKIKMNLVYSKDYLEKNYLKQIIFTTLKLCSIIIFMLIGSIFAYIGYSNYATEKKTETITTDLKSLLVDENSNSISMDNISSASSLNTLLSKNKESVGWLTVLNTNIDYPVVQHSDNNYYLKHNYYKVSDKSGWVFMDYRNNSKDLDTNTIIYAHNRYYSGVMFGTLRYVTRKSWYTNEDNLYITFNTLDKKMKWKIFSFYSIDVTSDYLYTNFETKEDYQKFLNMITKRRKVKLDTKVTTDDKILTLSTCLDNNKRLVVHAVLVSEE